MERLFSVGEADVLLPELRERLTRLREARARVVDATAGSGLRAASNGSSAAAAGSAGAERALGDEVAALEGLGVILRDLDTGLVDFAAERDGEPIYLCWREPEERVSFWHPRDAGFAARLPL